MWLHGPSWLTSRGNHSEEDDPPKEIPEECWMEHKVSVVPTLLTTEPYGISNLIEIVNYNDIDRLLPSDGLHTVVPAEAKRINSIFVPTDG